jgi:hypothetical protein
MKKYILLFVTTCGCVIACNPKSDTSTTTTSAASASTVTLPYKASYGTEFTNNVSDSDLLTVLNSYKDWEQGDMKALRTTMGDSMYADMSDGYHFKGLADSVMGIWGKYRDSLSSVKIDMGVWLKNHSVKDSADYINVWYKEIDTFKSGKVDSANFEDDNGMKNGKIIWLSSHKQKLKKD